jgi:predicted nucleic acid-binding protein
VKRVILDTNLYISFMNTGEHESVMLGAGFVRHMSAVVLMELLVGARTPAARRAVARLERAFEATGRVLPPPPAAWKRAGGILRGLRASGREVRRASLVNDVLIALTARDIGATVITNDASDFGAIRKLVDFSFEAV